ncbi:MAG: hypothetical protein J6W27_04885, partial [Alphaproteobacteria bacterium]|nr:hypothetical protein [Alphaproteobacteria bacterium]
VAAKATPVMEHTCACGKDCPCGCHKHGSMHVIKHIIVWAIIFALGMACGKMMNCQHPGKKMMFHHKQPVFTNGCLDIQSIECPKMQEDIVKADVNGDNCISIEEYKTFKKENRQMFRKGMRGPKKPRNK